MKAHNQYPTTYHRTLHEFLDRTYGEDNSFYTFIRASHLYTPKYAYSMWAGDQTMDFDPHNGLPTCIVNMLSSGLVGFSNTHCDVGGYIHLAAGPYTHSDRNDNLMIQWMQLAAFSPVFRTHEGNHPESLQVYSNPTMRKNFSLYTTLFSLLSNYRK